MYQKQRLKNLEKFIGMLYRIYNLYKKNCKFSMLQYMKYIIILYFLVNDNVVLLVFDVVVRGLDIFNVEYVIYYQVLQIVEVS